MAEDDPSTDATKKVVVVDPHCSSGSPSMKHLVAAFPHLRAAGWEVEVWAMDVEDEGGIDRFVRAPDLRLPGHLGLFGFHLWVLWKHLLRPAERDGAVFFSGGYYHPDPDLIAVHFSQPDWTRQRRRFADELPPLSWAERLVGIPFGKLGHQLLRRRAEGGRCKFLPVSEAVADDLREDLPPGTPIEVLPNTYEPERFSVSTRETHRSGQRKAFGFGDDAIVFSFVSLGHYARKGFLKAVRILVALRELRPTADIRLLVIGGRDKDLEILKNVLAAEDPDWEDWVCLAGFTPEPETYLAAADAFLFPSYSEAFALVEIEAGAMGLRLYLTPHHGSEMILREGENGRLLDWDVGKAAAVLAEEIDAGAVQPGAGDPGRALTAKEYADRLEDILEGARRK